MKNPNVRVGLEAWNFCNEVGAEAPKMGSPRLADCADLYCPLIVGMPLSQPTAHSSSLIFVYVATCFKFHN